jgi:hypothetical protein
MRSTERPSSSGRRALRPRRRSLLRDVRGGASAEGAIVATFMAILFAATLFVYRGYREQLATVRSPTRGLWVEATRGCDTGPQANEVISPLGGYPATANRNAPTVSRRWNEIRQRQLERTDSASVTEGTVLGGDTVRFEESAQIGCGPSGVFERVDWRAEAMALFCDRHPDPRWPEGCDVPPGTLR